MPDTQNTTGEPLRGGQGFPPDNPVTGEPGLIGKDDFTRQYEIDRLTRPRVDVLAGNIADLHRQAYNQNVVTNPAVDPNSDTVITPAEHDALKGEWTVESEREGLVSAPTPPTPRENHEPNSVDPEAVSPEILEKTTPSTSRRRG